MIQHQWLDIECLQLEITMTEVTGQTASDVVRAVIAR
jgi:hypothetical protein